MGNRLEWDLAHIVDSDRLTDEELIKKFSEMAEQVYAKLPQYAELFSRLSPGMDPSEFHNLIDFDEEVGEAVNRLSSLGDLMSSKDTKSEPAILLESRADQLEEDYHDACRPTEHWIMGKIPGSDKLPLDDENAARLFRNHPLEYKLDLLRKHGKHILTEKEERIISRKDAVGGDVLGEVRDLLASEKTFFLKVPGRRGRTYTTESEVRRFFTSPDPQLREAAYLCLLQESKQNLIVNFIIYKAIVKDWCNDQKLRGYASPISMRNFKNQVPDAAVETLLGVCAENIRTFQDYFVFKARELGMPKLRRFDVYAPLPGCEDTFSFEKGKGLILDTFGSFCPGFEQRARQIFDEEHVDSHPAPNKRGGAFCSTPSPKKTPYILLNYMGRLEDVLTVAHELGHGIHSLYANQHTITAHHAPLPLAETASTFAELVLFEQLLHDAPPEARKAMLAKEMADAYATIIRQNYIVVFERAAHAAIDSRESITAEKLSDEWMKTLDAQFGGAVDIDPLFRYEWAQIPHIVHSPFYCYSYNFGSLLSMALFAMYKDEGQKFIPKLEAILQAGGSRDPQAILKDVGVDMNAASFWQSSFDIIKGWQQELEGYRKGE